MAENLESVYTILEKEYAEQKPEAELSFEDALRLAIPVVFSFKEGYVTTDTDVEVLVKMQPFNLGLLNMFREPLSLNVEKEPEQERIFIPGELSLEDERDGSGIEYVDFDNL